MKNTFNPTSSAWNKYRAKTNNRARGLMLVVGIMLSIFMVGALTQPKTGAGAATVVMSAALVGGAFAKRQGSIMPHFKEDDHIEVGKLSTEAEKTLLDKVKEVVNEQLEKDKS